MFDDEQEERVGEDVIEGKGGVLSEISWFIGLLLLLLDDWEEEEEEDLHLYNDDCHLPKCTILSEAYEGGDKTSFFKGWWQILVLSYFRLRATTTLVPLQTIKLNIYSFWI